MKFYKYIEEKLNAEEVWVCLVHYISGSKKAQKLMVPSKCSIVTGKLYENGKQLTARTTDGVYVDVFDSELECYIEFHKQCLQAKEMVKHCSK